MPTTNNAVQIVISATDNASGVIAGIQTNLDHLAKLVGQPLQTALSSFSRTATNVSQEVSGTLGAIASAFTDLSDRVSNGVDIPLDGITRSLDQVPQLFDSAFTKGTSQAQDAVSSFFASIPTDVAKWFGGIPSELTGAVNSAFDKVVPDTGRIESALKPVGTVIPNSIEPGLADAQGNVANFFESIPDKVTAWLSDLPATFSAAINNAVDSVVLDVSSFSRSLTNSISNAFKGALAGVALAGAGFNPFAGLLGSVDKGISGALGNVSQIGSSISGALTTGFTGATRSVDTFFGGIPTRVPKLLANLPDIVSGTFNDAVSNVTPDLSGVQGAFNRVSEAFATGFEPGIEAARTEVEAFFKEIAQNAPEWMRELPQTITETFENAFGSIDLGQVQAGFLKFGGNTVSVFSAIGDGIKETGGLISNLDTILQTTLGANLRDLVGQQIDALNQEMEEATQVPLSQILKTIGSAGVTGGRSFFSGFGGAVVDELGEFFPTFSQGLAKGVNAASSAIPNTVKSAFKSTKPPEPPAPPPTDYLNTFTDAISTDVNNITKLPQIAKAGETIVNRIATGLDGGKDRIDNAFAVIGDVVQAGIQGNLDVSQIGKTINNGLTIGFADGTSSVGVFFQDVSDKIQSGVSSIPDFNNIGKTVSDGLATGLADGQNTVASVFDGLLAPLKTGISNIPDLSVVGTALSTGLTTGLSDGKAKLAGFFSDIGQVAKSSLSGGLDFAQVGATITTGLGSGLTQSRDAITSLFDGVLDPIREGVKTIPDLSKVGTTITGGLASGIASGRDKVVSVFSGILAPIQSGLTNIPDFSKAGATISNGLGVGLADGGGKVTSFFHDVTKTVRDGASNLPNLSQIGTTLSSGLSSGLNTGRNTVQAAFSSLFDPIANGVVAVPDFSSVGAKLSSDLGRSIADSKTALKPLVDGLFGPITDSLNALPDFSGVGATLSSGLSVGLADGQSKVESLLSGLFKPIQDSVANPPNFNTVGAAISNGLSSGLASGQDKVDALFSGLLKPIKDGFKGIPDFSKVGTAISNGLAVGFADGQSKVGTLFSGLLKPIQDGINTIPDFSAVGATISQSLTSGFTSATDPINTFFAGAIASVTAGIDDLTTSLPNVGTTLTTAITASVNNGVIASAFASISAQIPTWLKDAPAQIIDTFDRAWFGVKDSFEKTFSTIDLVGDVGAQLTSIGTGADDYVELFGLLKNSVAGVTETISAASQQVFFFFEGFGQLQGLVENGPYKLLVQQNIELQQQLLETQASLVATNKVMQNGQQIVDPAAAIQALNAPVRSAIAQLRTDSLELVGVTSKDLVSVFQIVEGQASTIGVNIQQAEKLTVSFSAALGTMGVPLSQSRQEIDSILTAQTDSNSIVAKNLGLNNDLIRRLTDQGKLYDFLNDKLSAFREGNKLQAQTIDGVFSNIQEQVDTIGLGAGAQLLEPIVDQLNKVYSYIQGNFKTISDFVKNLVSQFSTAGQYIAEAVGMIFSSVAPLLGASIGSLFNFLVTGAKGFRDAIAAMLPIFQPFIDSLTLMIAGAGQLSDAIGGLPFTQIFFQFKILTTGAGLLREAFGTVASITPILGEAMFLMNGRANGLIGTFTNLSSVMGSTSAAAGLLLGKHMTQIPFVADIIQNKISGLLGPFSAFGGTITALVPQMSTGAIAVLGLAQKFPVLQTTLNDAAKLVPGLLGNVADLAESKGFGALGQALKGVSGDFDGFLQNTNLASFANEKLSEVTKQVRAEFIKTAATTGLVIAGLAALAIIVIEVTKRMHDAGTPIRDLAKETESTSELIRGTWDKTRETTSKGLFDKQEVPPTDWIDAMILKTRELEQGTLQVNDALGALQAVGAVIAEAFDFVVKVVQSAVVVVFEGIHGIVASIEAVADIAKNPFDTKNLESAFGRLKGVGENASEGLQETWSRNFGKIQTKGEKSVMDIANALGSGELQRGVKGTVDEINGLISSGLQPGKLFEKELEPVGTAIANLKNKTGSVKDVRDAIAQLPDAIPADRKREFLDLVDKDFPNGVAESGEAADAFNAKLDGLGKQLGLTGADASNLRLEEIRNKLDDNIQSLTQQIDALKRSGQGYSGNARELRNLEGRLKTAKDAFDKFNQSTTLEQDPTAKLEDILKAGDAKIKQVASAATADEKERLAKSTEAYAKHQQNKETLELNQLTTSQESQRKQYAETQKQLSAAQAQYNKLTPQERDRASPQLEKINQLRAQAAEQRTKIAQNEVDKEEKLRSNATDKAGIVQQKALDVAKAAENDRLKNIQTLVNKGAISQTEADEQRKNSTVSNLRTQLSAEQAHLKQLESIAAKYPKTGAEGEKQQQELRQARLKTQEFTTQILEQERSAYEAHIASITATLEREGNTQEAKDEQLVRSGVISREQAEQDKADFAVKRLQAELALETKDKDKRAQIELQLQQAITAQREAGIKARLQLLENASNVEAAADERAVRDGVQIREESETHKAAAAVKRIQTELDGENDVSKKAALRLQLEEAITKQQDAEVQKRLKLIDIANNKEQALDEEAYRTGKIRKEQVEVDRAQSTVSRLEQELALEKDNIEKRTALELQLQQAKTSLQEAQLSQRKAQIEEENQTYQNQLDKQLAPLQAQQSVFELLNKALENRNKLLSASQDLMKAGTGYITGELEAISSVETSEYRRKQLAQGMAAIKLEAAKKEAEMTKASLDAEEQMQKFALMREQIENRVAIARQTGETAKLQGQIAVAEADPRTTKAQRDALFIQLDAAKQQEAQLRGVGVLLAQQAPLQERAFAMQRRSKELQADAGVTQATAALINTLGPGAKERAARAFQEQESQKVFGTDYRDVRYGSRALARQAVDEAVPGARLGPGAGISAFAPYLEEVGGSVSALAQASSDFARTMGPAATAGAGLVGVGAKPLQLPDVVGKVPGLEEINRTSKDAIAQSLVAYQQTGLKLPPTTGLGQVQLPKVATDGLAKSSTTFEKAVAQFAKAVQSNQAKPVAAKGNVTLNVQQQQATDLANVLNYAKQLTGG